MADGFKERYEEHMVGRNGADAIARICLVLALVLVLLSFATVSVSPFLYVLVLVLGIASALYALFRMNSKNVAARKAEVASLMGVFKREGSARTERPSKDAAARPRRSARPRSAARDEQAAEEKAEEGTQEASEPAPAEKVTVSCESCGQRLSVPAGKGAIRITCPKCKERFVART